MTFVYKLTLKLAWRQQVVWAPSWRLLERTVKLLRRSLRKVSLSFSETCWSLERQIKQTGIDQRQTGRVYWLMDSLVVCDVCFLLYSELPYQNQEYCIMGAGKASAEMPLFFVEERELWLLLCENPTLSAREQMRYGCYFLIWFSKTTRGNMLRGGDRHTIGVSGCVCKAEVLVFFEVKWELTCYPNNTVTAITRRHENKRTPRPTPPVSSQQFR